jgi:two-component system, LytTR family, response regulator
MVMLLICPIEILTRAGTQLISPKKILFIKAKNTSTEVFCSDLVISSSRSLSWFEKKLNRECFCRCHRSFLINLAFVLRYSANGFELTNGKKVLISKYRKPQVINHYINFVTKKESELYYSTLPWH